MIPAPAKRIPVRRGCALLVLAALAACTSAPAPSSLKPQVRPAALAPRTPPPPAERSPESRALEAYYLRVQQDQLAQGLLRRDGGGPDTPFTDTDLLRNFERIVFYDEYRRGAGLSRGDNLAGGLRRWDVPVRIGVEFGASVPDAQRDRDRRTVRNFAARLARVSGHPIAASDAGSANFTVMFMGEDDRAQALARVRELVPNINADSLDLFRALPRSIHCLVLAFSGTENDYAYKRAIALVRAEHPPLMRDSCVHEELAQGLGLANDSPRARPSIFNDDDEFALLTTHDEMLLKMLYDRRLRTGMSAEEARPILRILAAEMTNGSI